MDNKQRNAYLKIVRALSAIPCAKPFLKPVDAVALGVLDYYNIITNPMDLSTIKKKLMDKQYKTKQEFVNDILLICENCRNYNTDPHNHIRMLCEEFQSQFEFQMDNYEKRLEAEKKRLEEEEKERLKQKEEKAKEELPVKRPSNKKYSNFIKKLKKTQVYEEIKSEQLEDYEENIEDKDEQTIHEEINHLVLNKLDSVGPSQAKTVEYIWEDSVKNNEEELEEVLDLDKLRGKDLVESVIKLKIPEQYEEPESSSLPVQSQDYMEAVLVPLFNPESLHFTKQKLVKALFD